MITYLTFRCSRESVDETKKQIHTLSCNNSQRRMMIFVPFAGLAFFRPKNDGSSCLPRSACIIDYRSASLSLSLYYAASQTLQTSKCHWIGMSSGALFPCANLSRFLALAGHDMIFTRALFFLGTALVSNGFE
jgi:hypothetical protein